MLRRIELVDWYTDDGIIYLDLLDTPVEHEIKQLTEYHQLEDILKQINQFRLWCANASLNEIESMISNGVSKPSEINQTEFSPNLNPITNTVEEYAFYQ